MDQRTLSIVLKLKDDLTGELNRVGIAIGEVEKQTKNYGIAVGDTQVSFKSMAATGGAVFAGLGVGVLDSVRAFESFNEEIKRAGAFVNASESELKSFRDAAIDAARGTQFSFEQTAVALQNFVGGEIDAATATEELGSVIDLALVAKLNDLQQAVNVGSLALTVFQQDGMEMADVIDIIATVAADVTTETDKWATALVNSSGAAKASGMSFKDLNVIFSTMVRGGADANLMWSAFNSAMTRVQAPTKQTQEALASVGLSAEGLGDSLREGPVQFLQYLKRGFEEANRTGQGFAFLTNVLGAQAAPEFALALGLTNEQLAETADYFSDIDGRGAEMVGSIRDAQSATKEFGQAMGELRLAFGSAFEGVGALIGDTLTPMVRVFADFVREHPVIVGAIVAIVGAIAGLVAVVGIIGAMIPAITAGFALLGGIFTVLLGPIGLVILAIAALIAAGVLLYQHWDSIKAFAGSVWEGIANTITESINAVGTAFSAVWEGIKATVAGAADFIRNVWEGLMSWVSTQIERIINMVERALDALSALPGVGSVINAGRSVLRNIGDLFRANGGPVSSGVPYIVGEKGPELFVPSGSGAIVPNHALAGTGGGFGGVNITIYGDVTGEEIIDRVKRALSDDIKYRVRV